jgi:hypothetical protein
LRVQSIHTRAIPAPAQTTGSILDSLAGPDDRIWPIERWPNDPIAFDRPLAVGARGGHGPIPYTVVAYEPGWLIEFEFAPGSGLHGGHCLEGEPDGTGAARLRHVLDAEVEGVYRVLRPIVLGMHDALVEDLLDKAELAATGHLKEPARWPRWLRFVNSIEVALRPRRGRFLALAVPGALLATRSIHSAWALGRRWPGAFAERGVSDGSPPATCAMWAVRAAVVAAAAVVHRAANGAGGTTHDVTRDFRPRDICVR